MTISVICKASTHIGLGHLIRTNTFINQILASNSSLQIEYFIIGDPQLRKLITNEKINIHTCKNEFELKKIPQSRFLILDMLDMDESVLIHLQQFAGKTVVFSPVFNNFAKADFYFGRTKYLGFDAVSFPRLKIFAGFDYAIIQNSCRTISAGIFEENLKNETFPIAVCMGGGDASNKTLQILKALKKCKINATFWVMLGEGYKHSFDILIDEIRKDTSHEIILAKTNSSMWNILKNCVLCILHGGITSFEAVYAGLPAINFFELPSQQFLLKEIIDNNAAFDLGIYSGKMLDTLPDFIQRLYDDKKQLLQMHVNTKHLIDGNGSHRIFQTLLNH